MCADDGHLERVSGRGVVIVIARRDVTVEVPIPGAGRRATCGGVLHFLVRESETNVESLRQTQAV